MDFASDKTDKNKRKITELYKGKPKQFSTKRT